VLLESVFRRYMTQLQRCGSTETRIDVRSDVLRQSPAKAEENDLISEELAGHEQAQLELTIHAPQFYRQMVTYPRVTDYLRHTLLHPYEENRTAWSNNADRLITYLASLEEAAKKEPRFQKSPGLLQSWVWAIFEWLRTMEQLTGVYPSPGLPGKRTTTKDVYHAAVSPLRRERSALDQFVYDRFGTWLQIRYMWAVLKLQWRAKVMNAIGGE
jgi:hypothetical protein